MVVGLLTLQTALAGGSIGVLWWSRSVKAVDDMVLRLSEQTASSVERELDEMLSVPVRLNHLNVDAITASRLHINKETGPLEELFWRHIQRFPQVSLTYMGDIQGQYVGNRRHAPL